MAREKRDRHDHLRNADAGEPSARANPRRRALSISLGAQSFLDESAGQLDFFEKFGLYEATFADHTDGVYKGTLFEFKLKIDRPSRVLSQAIKYLSRMRNGGKSIPANILLVDLNARRAYHYKSADYLREIETQYQGAASRSNDDFAAKDPLAVINYSDPDGMRRVLEIIADESYTKVHIDLYDVIGWANRYYDEKPRASKVEMFEELRNPQHFADLLYAWKGNEDDFKYIMDCLNDRQHRKELGAFYTPPEYAELSAKLLRKAIKAIPIADCDDDECIHRYENEREHKHYIILDRCAGTGNLEEPLTDEELSHTVVVTYELKEWVVLNSRFGGKVRAIIPPTPDHDQGLLNGGDALAQEVLAPVRDYVEDETCNVILLENPPYSDAAADARQTKQARGEGKRTLIAGKMRGTYKPPMKGMQPTKELANLFIWSAWRYYLRKPGDAYVLYAPIKYWKSHELSNKRFVGGYLFNRKYFHASPSAISCILWLNKDDAQTDAITLEAMDIENGQVKHVTKVEVLKVRLGFNQMYFDKRSRPGDTIDGIYCGPNGREVSPSAATSADRLYNADMLAYLYLVGLNFGPQKGMLTRATLPYRKNGFYLRSDNFLVKMPLFAAKNFPERKWYEKGIYCTTADGGDAYERDKGFLKACFIWSCLSEGNHCVSLDGSDGRSYRNEFCFDSGTVASKSLGKLSLNVREKELLQLWRDARAEAERIGKLTPGYTYGPHQIGQEINTSSKDAQGNTVYDHPVLNDKLIRLKGKLSAYYDAVILPKLFKYQLVK